jgi:hypothetical protein
MKALILTIADLVLFSSCKELAIYESYMIKKGASLASSKLEWIDENELSFDAIFDSTAIVQSEGHNPQIKLNKLLGVVDFDAHPSINSASFEWQWNSDHLDIYAFNYSEGEQFAEMIGTAQMDESNHYQITLTAESCIFTFKNNKIFLLRNKDV